MEQTVIVGNVKLYPATIRESLRKDTYYLSYDPEKETLRLTVNGQNSGTLFELRQVSYESAVKVADLLGLKAEGSRPLTWLKWNPELFLHHDGSDDAETLRMRMLALGVPHRIGDAYSGKRYALTNHAGVHYAPAWSLASMLKIVEETAERYKDQLTTTP